MRRAAALVLLAACACGCSGAHVRIESRSLAHQSNLAPDRLIVAGVDNGGALFVARAGSTPRGYDAVTTYAATSHALRIMRALEEEYGLREVNAWPIEPLHMHCAVLEAPEGTDRAELLSQLSHDARVMLAQPLQTFATRAGQYNDPYVELQRGFRQMDVAGAHPLSQGEGVKVAVIDTGVDIQHKDLRGNIASAANFVDGNSEQFLRDRHGTEVAGVIAAVANNREGIVGIAPRARIQVYKACWQLQVDSDDARCNSFTIARALVAAFDERAQVVNLSIAGPEDPLLTQLIREGQRRGIIFVGAASTDTAASSLFRRSGVIEVASAETASPDESVLHAPGREILTLLPGGHYDFATGDSIATAEVTGVVSLLLAKDRSLSADAVRDILRDSSSPPGAGTGEDGAALDRKFVDACAAVAALLRRGTCAQVPDVERRLAGEQAHRVVIN